MDVLEGPPPIEIPIETLSEEARLGVLNEFIEREGTDYGAVEATLERKQNDLIRQLRKGDIKLIFDPATETVTLMTAKQFSDRISSRST